MEIFIKPFNNCNMLQIGCSFLFRLVVLSRNTQGYWVPHNRCYCTHVSMAGKWQRPGKRVSCQGWSWGLPAIRCHLDKVYGSSWLWPHLH